jgi:hypothetical protein
MPMYLCHRGGGGTGLDIHTIHTIHTKHTIHTIGGGAVPDSAQTQKYLMRNELLTEVDNVSFNHILLLDYCLLIPFSYTSISITVF